jgi:hypothetical protein
MYVYVYREHMLHEISLAKQNIPVEITLKATQDTLHTCTYFVYIHVLYFLNDFVM